MRVLFSCNVRKVNNTDLFKIHASRMHFCHATQQTALKNKLSTIKTLHTGRNETFSLGFCWEQNETICPLFITKQANSDITWATLQIRDVCSPHPGTGSSCTYSLGVTAQFELPLELLEPHVTKAQNLLTKILLTYQSPSC